MYSSNGTITKAGGALTDAAGNEVIVASLLQNNEVLLQYPGPNGTTSTYTLTYNTYMVNMDFGCPGLTVPTAWNYAMPITLQYPDGTSANFAYEANPLHAGTITGRIASISTPSGAQYTYTYTGGTHGVNCSDGTTSGITKVTPDGTWTITHTAGSGSTNRSTTKTTAPSGDYTKDTIVSVLADPKTPLVFPQMSTVASLSYDSGNNLLASKYICYNGNHPSSPLSCANPSTAPGFSVSEIDEWNYIPGVANPSLKVTLLDNYLRVTDVKTYDFGGTVGGTNYDTDVQTAYGSWNGTSCVPINVNYNYGVSVNIPLMDKVCSKKTVVSGGTVASYFTYGMSGNSFGELVTRQDTVGGVLVTTDNRTYDSLGRVLTSTGPNGEITTSAYTQCSGQELSSVTVKTNTSGGALTTSYSGYDCVGEKTTTTTDPNGNSSYVNFGSDPFWRPVSTTDAAGIVTNYTYYTAGTLSGPGGPATDVQTTIVAGSSSAETMTRFDTSGRIVLNEVRQGPSSSQWTITKTDYDSDGRVSQTTLPYSGTDGTTSIFKALIAGTTTTYDGLGRVKTVEDPAYNTSTPGSTLTYTYSANDVLVTQSPAPSGENVKSRQTERNGLGEITSVCEITTMAGSASCGQSTAATGFLTTYSYYPGGKLQSITQNANGSTQQVRSFTYDNLNTGRPLTTQTPESGLVTTTYDAGFIGFPTTITDNAGATLSYGYDMADRLVQVSYSTSDHNTLKRFFYDSTSSISCNTGANQAGQIAMMSTTKWSTHPEGRPVTLSEVSYCYDPDGRPTDTFATHGGVILETPYHVSETWFPNGVSQTLTVPGQPVITYSLDSMGRVTSAFDGTSTLLSSTSYFLDNSPNVVTYGNGDTSTYTEFSNHYPSTVTHAIGTGASNTIAHSPTWNSNGTLKQLVTNDQIYPANSQTCTFSYDDLIRLTTDNCGTNWNESSAYDPFGNITKSGSFPWPSGGYNQLNNRYASTAFTYDANGRLTNDSFDTLGWDVFGNLTTQSGTGIVYDAMDRTFITSVGGASTIYLYAPDGGLVGTANDSTGTVQQMYVSLPNSRAVYSGGVPSYFDHYDWQGSARVSSTWARGVYSDITYDAFGMPYWTAGATNNQYAGLTNDFSTGTEQASESCRYHPSQGRWESPDDGIPDPYNPQTFNAYHYSLNMPTSTTDPDGQDEVPYFEYTFVYNGAYAYEIDQQFFNSTSNAAALWQSSSIGGALYPQAVAQQMAQSDRNILAQMSGGTSASVMSFLSDTVNGGAKGLWNNYGAAAINLANNATNSLISPFTSFRFPLANEYQGSTPGEKSAMAGIFITSFFTGAGEESTASKGSAIVENIFSHPKGLESFLSESHAGALGDLLKSLGWDVGTLRKGSHAGEGMRALEMNAEGKLTGRGIMWHPGGGHHGPDAYWKVSSPLGGTVRVGPQFK